jgi:hypothetical protein
MLHRSSGRDNFGVIKHGDKTKPSESQQQLPVNTVKTIQEQTGAAIEVATKMDDDNSKTTSTNKGDPLF